MALRVMVVDDALFMRNMLKDIFVRAGHDVVGEAENGEVALELYQQVKPDLVTMDIVMPKKSGIEALQDIIAIDPTVDRRHVLERLSHRFDEERHEAELHPVFLDELLLHRLAQVHDGTHVHFVESR